MVPNEWKSVAIQAAIDAGAVIMRIYNNEFAVEYKADESPLTLADQEADDLIQERLKTTGVPVLSEEGAKEEYANRKDWTRCWIVDPLDGTKEFVKRNGEFTVNIALAENGVPVFGVVYAPALGWLYMGEKGNGAHRTHIADPFHPMRGNRTVEHLPAQEFPAVTTIVGSRSHASPETEAFIESIRKEKGEVDFAASGSSLKFCLVAEGRAHVYPRFAPTMEWDTAAGQAVLEAAGGEVIRHDTNEPLRYNKENLLNPWFIARMK